MPRPSKSKPSQDVSARWLASVQEFLGTKDITPELVVYRLWWWRRLDRLLRNRCISGPRFEKYKMRFGAYRSELSHREWDDKDQKWGETKEYGSEVDHWNAGDLAPRPNVFHQIADVGSDDRLRYLHHWRDIELLSRIRPGPGYLPAVDADWDESPAAKNVSLFAQFIREAPGKDEPTPVFRVAARKQAARQVEPAKIIRGKNGFAIKFPPIVLQKGEADGEDLPGERAVNWKGETTFWHPSTVPPKMRDAVRRMDRHYAEQRGLFFADGLTFNALDPDRSVKKLRRLLAKHRKMHRLLEKRRSRNKWLEIFHVIERMDREMMPELDFSPWLAYEEKSRRRKVDGDMLGRARTLSRQLNK